MSIGTILLVIGIAIVCTVSAVHLIARWITHNAEAGEPAITIFQYVGLAMAVVGTVLDLIKLL